MKTIFFFFLFFLFSIVFIWFSLDWTWPPEGGLLELAMTIITYDVDDERRTDYAELNLARILYCTRTKNARLTTFFTPLLNVLTDYACMANPVPYST